MKTLFICSSRKVNSHVGEEYDVILEVEDQPTTSTIAEWAHRIKDKIRFLWHEQEGSDDRRVVCYLDGPTPYNAILNNLQIIMKDEEGIVVELPYMVELRQEVTDPETIELLSKLEGGSSR
jgi:hypothetical protein